MYFTVDSMEKGAFFVHKLSMEKLYLLSEGKRFCDFADEICNDFSNAELLVAHNISFDLAFLNAEFERLNMALNIKNRLCTMRYFTPFAKLLRSDGKSYKYPNLKELIMFANIFENEIFEFAAENFNIRNAGLHDARIDASAVYASVEKLCGKNLELKQLIAEGMY